MTNVEEQLKQVLEQYRSAVRTRDLGGFISLYREDVRIFDAWGVWSYEGTTIWRQAVGQWFASLQDETVHVAFDDLKVEGDSHFALASATVNFAAMSAEGKELRSMQNRATWAFRQGDGGWKIVHEHTSVPVGYDDLKAILGRGSPPS